jgi:hypothetical protein
MWALQVFQQDKVARNTHVELQQRAVEYFNLGARAPDDVLVRTVYYAMPAVTDTQAPPPPTTTTPTHTSLVSS